MGGDDRRNHWFDCELVWSFVSTSENSVSKNFHGKSFKEPSKKRIEFY